jgi:hypothetical protein
LVSRHWVNAAQSHLFRAPAITTVFTSFSDADILWTRFLETLDTSQHLIRHIRHLDIKHNNSMLCLPKLCSFPFTHLESVLISYARHNGSPAVAYPSHPLPRETMLWFQ